MSEQVTIKINGTEIVTTIMQQGDQNIGYSVCGYADIFPEDEIENPIWDSE